MAYRIRGQGQFTAPTSRTGRGYIFGGRRVLVKGENFQLTWNGPAVIEAVMNALEEALQDLSNEALNYMQSIVPVDTGATRDSCFVEIVNIGGRLSLVIGAGTPYTVYIELGTFNHPARPFIRPTADYVKQRLPGILKNEVQRRANK
jgi:HK97 gp10 family phage protein